MTEYIDRESAKRAVDYAIELSNSEYDAVCNALDGIPDADVAPVVRCKDCKWHRERDEQERKYLVEGVLICTNSDFIDDGWNSVFPDDFCSYGERK